jgi:hypothetical protein
MTTPFCGFYELVYPVGTKYNTVTDDSVFNSFLPSEHSYVSKTSFDFYDMQKMVDEISIKLKEEMARLQKLFPDLEFRLVYTPPGGDDETEYNEDPEQVTEDESVEVTEPYDQEIAAPEDDDPSIGVFTLYNDTEEDVVCHIEAFTSSMDDDDFTPSYHFSSTIH